MSQPTHKVVNGIRIELPPEERQALMQENRKRLQEIEKHNAEKSMRASRREELLHKLGLSMDDWKLIIGD